MGSIQTRWFNLDNLKDLQEIKELRKQIFKVGYKGGMAHLASCFSCIEILYALYIKGVLKIDFNNPFAPTRDRLVLSKGHAGLALYSILVKVGLMKEDDLNSYLQPGTNIGGEPCMRDLKIVEATTGSLGHGLSMAVGLALGQRINKTTAKTYVIVGDGELEEGTVWEGVMSASAFKLDNLIVILDCNKIQKMDTVDNIMGFNNWKEKWTAFGWDVVEVKGHDINSITSVLSMGNNSLKPRIVIADTIKGKGVSIMENNPNWHFKLPNKKELKIFQAELGLSKEEMEDLLCKEHI